MFKAVIFDLDNTLIDFLKMKRMSCGAAMDAMIGAGLPMNHQKGMQELFKLYDQYGMEEKTIFQKFLTQVMGTVDYKVLASGIVAYRNVRSGFMDAYPNVDYTLLQLKSHGIKIGLVTDAPRLKAWIRLASIKLTNYFDVVITHEDTKQHKPSPAPFKAALSNLKLEASECLMVGDWPERDIKGAKNLGMKTCFAKYGNPKARAVADYTISDIRQLIDIVMGNKGTSA